ncbi:MAG: DUF1566 domain-containing protein [Campylobacteraceae bacterium]|nr:DUF1566 domain-containing protein [Campylobacteraceae bacterium]
MNYLKSFLSIVFITLLFSACSSESKVRVVADLEKADVLVDGKKLGQIRIGYSTFSLPTGEHKISVEKYSKNKEWKYISSKSVEIKADNINYVEFEKIEKKPTQKRLDRLAKEEADKKAYLASLWNSKEIVEDEDAGVFWQNIEPNKISYKIHNQKKEMINYCQNLEFAQMKEWRLPTHTEMDSILKSKKLSKIGKYHRDNKWHGGEHSYFAYKNYASKYFLCVHDTPTKIEQKEKIAKKYGFGEYPKGIYIDEVNKLFWENPILQKKAAWNLYDKKTYGTPSGSSVAVKNCKNFNLHGLSNWRLPTTKELLYIAENKQPMFMNFKPTYYMSSERKYATYFNKPLNDTINLKNGYIVKKKNNLQRPYYVCVKEIYKKSNSNVKSNINEQVMQKKLQKSVASAKEQKNLNSLDISKTYVEDNKWQAIIKVECLDKNKECGSIDFRSLKCGGSLVFKDKKDSVYVFNEKLKYGKCVSGCQIKLNIKENIYGEYCSGRRTGGGKVRVE